MKIMVISPNKALKEEILHSLKNVDASKHALVFDNDVNDLTHLTEDEHPELVIIDGICVENGNLNTLEQICTSAIQPAGPVKQADILSVALPGNGLGVPPLAVRY